MMRHCFVAYALKKILKTLFTKPGPMWKRCRRAAARRSCGDEPAQTAPGGTHDEPQPVQRHPALDTTKPAVHGLTGLVGGDVPGYRRSGPPAFAGGPIPATRCPAGHPAMPDDFAPRPPPSAHTPGHATTLKSRVMGQMVVAR